VQPNRHLSSPSTLRAVLFDLDGTLIATRRLMVASYALALAPILGYTPGEPEIMAKSPRAVRAFLAEMAGLSNLSACIEQFYHAYEALYATHFEDIYQGVIDMLTRLRQLGLPIGVVTGMSRRTWRIASKHIDLGPFDTWVFDDDVAHIKPHPEGIERALKRLALAPEQTMYLGDSLTDLIAAQAAGVLPGAVLWPKRASEIETFIQEATSLGASIFSTPTCVVDFCSGGTRRR
jgi:pyrophosphatase PpaX